MRGMPCCEHSAVANMAAVAVYAEYTIEGIPLSTCESSCASKCMNFVVNKQRYTYLHSLSRMQLITHAASMESGLP